MSEPLDLEPIRLRAGENEYAVRKWGTGMASIGDRDRAVLLTEVDRLSAQIAAVLELCDSADRRSADGRGRRVNTRHIRDALGGAA